MRNHPLLILDIELKMRSNRPFNGVSTSKGKEEDPLIIQLVCSLPRFWDEYWYCFIILNLESPRASAALWYVKCTLMREVNPYQSVEKDFLIYIPIQGAVNGLKFISHEDIYLWVIACFTHTVMTEFLVKKFLHHFFFSSTEREEFMNCGGKNIMSAPVVRLHLLNTWRDVFAAHFHFYKGCYFVRSTP